MTLQRKIEAAETLLPLIEDVTELRGSDTALCSTRELLSGLVPRNLYNMSQKQRDHYIRT